MRTKHIATFAETIRTDPMTLAQEYLSARDATVHEFTSDEARDDYVAVLHALGRFQHRAGFDRALTLLDHSPKVPVAGAIEAPMRQLLWSFDEGPTFSGYTDDTFWNGFPNIWVDRQTWPYVLETLIAGADGDEDTIADYRALGDAVGLVALTHGFSTTEVDAKWTVAFPDYPIGSMPPIPDSWSDQSWHQDATPSFSPCTGPVSEVTQIWIDYGDPEKRDIPEAARFVLSRRNTTGDLQTIYVGDDYDDAVRHAEIEQLACAFAKVVAGALSPTEWQTMRVRNRAVPPNVCASHDFLDANLLMLTAWRDTRCPTIVGAGDVHDLSRDLIHVNAAWDVATRYYLTSDADGARFDAWRSTGHDVASLKAAGHDLGTVVDDDAPGRVYSIGFLEVHGTGWLCNVSNTSCAFEHLLDAEAHLWSSHASIESSVAK